MGTWLQAKRLGPSLAYVIFCKALGLPCMSNVDRYVHAPPPNWHLPLWHAYYCLPGNGKGSGIFIPKWERSFQWLAVCSSEYNFQTLVQWDQVIQGPKFPLHCRSWLFIKKFWLHEPSQCKSTRSLKEASALAPHYVYLYARRILHFVT